MTRAIALAGALALASCARSQSASVPAEGSPGAVAPVPAITLERTACFGRCPVYTIAVSSQGDVQYEGKAHVRTLGTATGKVPPQRVDTLLTELERAGYFTFADRYTSAEPSCGRYATDSPSVISSATVGGRTKRIVHDYGCGGAPGALVVLEQRIDEAVNSGQWTGR